jgi:hypothetical protein
MAHARNAHSASGEGERKAKPQEEESAPRRDGASGPAGPPSSSTSSTGSSSENSAATRPRRGPMQQKWGNDS